MKPSQGYILDTDAILNLTRRIYPLQVFPKLHNHMNQMIRKGIIVSSVEVLGELGINIKKKPNQWLTETEKGYPEEYNLPNVWAQKNYQIFLEFEPQLESIVHRITSNYNNVVKVKSTFGYDADIHLIALAVAHDYALITYEKPSDNPDKPKIPNICKDLGVKCMDLLEVFKEKNWSF